MIETKTANRKGNKMKNLDTKKRNATNNKLYEISKGLHIRIPLDDIFKAMEENNLIPLQEDGTRWEGFLCGATGSAHIDVFDNFIGQEVNCWLCLQWYRFDSGKYEVNAYIS